MGWISGPRIQYLETQQLPALLGCGWGAFSRCTAYGRCVLLLWLHFFCSKHYRAEGHGSDGMEDESVADAVKRSVWKMAMSLFSNFRFDADDDVVPCPIMLCSTMVSRLEFIFSSSDGSLVNVAFCVGFTGSVWRKVICKSFHFETTDGRTDG